MTKLELSEDDLQNDLPGSTMPHQSVSVGDYEVRAIETNGPYSLDLRDEATQTPGGIAFLIPLRGGHKHWISLRLGHPSPSGETFRIELNGTATRMQKTICRFNLSGQILAQGEEIHDLDIQQDQGGILVRLSFTPYRSTNEWIYVLAEKAPDRICSHFTVSAPTLRVLASPNAHLHREHFDLVDVSGVEIACQQLVFFQGVISAQFEIHRPGTQLLSLNMLCQKPVGAWKWWTWDGVSGPVATGMCPPVRPEFPINSPALMDRHGTAFSGKGHIMSGMYDERYDVERLGPDEVTALHDLTLTARFADGHVATIRLMDVTSQHNSTLSTYPILDGYCATILKSVERPKVLEVGARGASSASNRAFFGEAWDYRGFDIEPDSNVDVVGDAHELSHILSEREFDLVYSSEVMEHLFSPLKFVLEANRVLKLGGLFVARMPTTWPLHAEPWDFWRVSVHGWASILNEETGFEILDLFEIGRSAIVPLTISHENASSKMMSAPAPLLTLVIARKTRLVAQDTSGWPNRAAHGKYDRF